MLAVKSMDVRDNLKNLCDKVFNGETLIISRPKNENVVMLSEYEYNEIMKGAATHMDEKKLYYICRYDISQLFDILNLSRIDFDVFSVILSFSDEKKICRLSQEKIAKLTHRSRQNVNSSMNKLIKMNLIISTVFKTCHGKVLSTQVNIAELNELLKRYEKEIN